MVKSNDFDASMPVPGLNDFSWLAPGELGNEYVSELDVSDMVSALGMLLFHLSLRRYIGIPLLTFSLLAQS